MREQIKTKWIALMIELRDAGMSQNGYSPAEPRRQTTVMVGTAPVPANREVVWDRHYNALGALLELYRRETGIGEWQDGDVDRGYGASNFYIDGKCASVQFLPKQVREWAGINTPDPWIAGERMMGCALKNMISAMEAQNELGEISLPD